MEALVSYLIGFLLGKENLSYKKLIGYTSNENDFKNYRLVIIPSDFFFSENYGKKASYPSLPLKEIQGTPLLYGHDLIEKKGDTIILHADLIASSFFLLSRYEEIIKGSEEKRDKYGRFIGKLSLAYQADFINRPIVDEYGQILRNLLKENSVNIHETMPDFTKIILTHDVDKIEQYLNFRGFAGAFLRATFQANIKNMLNILRIFLFQQIEEDPLYTFQWLIDENKKIEKAETILFFKASNSQIKEDLPTYPLKSKIIQKLFQFCKNNQCHIGLHTSYKSSEKKEAVLEEQKKLSKASLIDIKLNRYHFLRTLYPQDLEALLEANISDDYTLAYPDVAGFRLGTSKPVLYINPISKEVKNLRLHPLLIMDASLDRKEYMNLTEDEAFKYSSKLISEVKKHRGELVLLWHNTSVSKLSKSYHQNLYQKIISHIVELS